jgi:DNA-binding response OmpR family regulator
MTFQALLVSKDAQAAATLTPVLTIFGMSVVPCEDAEAISLLREQKFDAVVVDFDSSNIAGQVLHSAQESFSGDSPVTIALLSDRSELRNLLRQGANFVLYKPLSERSTEAALSAAAALVKRYRRSFRVPVQAPVQLKLRNGLEVEGILLDLSEDGMHILAAQPLTAGAAIAAHFTLPDSELGIEAQGDVTWSNSNGQAGVRFLEISDDLRTTVKNWVAARAPAGPPQTFDPLPPCKLTDLSPGACYVETEAPFPEDSLVGLCLKAGDKEEQAEAIVRVMHPGFGMGLEFVTASADQRIGFIEFLASQPGIVPEVSVVPRALKAGIKADKQPSPATSGEPGEPTEGLEDPLLELLRQQSSLTQEDFLKNLQSQRGEPVASL